MDTPRFLSGKLLLAMPGIGDPRFEHAVIAMCVHDENGAVGIGIGHQRAGIGVRGLLEQLGIDPATRRMAPCFTADRSSRAGGSSSTATIGAGRTPFRSSASAR